MLSGFLSHRRAFIAAIFLFALGLALSASANSTPTAQARAETYGADVQSQVIAGSRLRVVVYDQGYQQPWTGSVAGPGGVTINWDAPQQAGDSSTVLYREDLEGGNYTVVPGSPVAPGWHVAAYLARANIDPSEACFSNGTFLASAFTSSATVNLTARNHSWVICVGVVRDGGLWDSQVGVRFVPNGPAGNWTGAIVGPQNVYYNFDDLLEVNSSGVVHGVVPGGWTVYPGKEPLPGYTVVGYYRYEMTTPDPVCPSDPAAYSNASATVVVSQEHPSWGICVKIAPSVANSTLWVQVVGAAKITPWAGNVNGPNSFQRTFASLGIGAGGNSGLLENLTAGTWTVAPAAVPAPGYQVLGFYITDGGSQTLCPVDAGSYSSQNSFQVNDQHPNRYVCILLNNPPIVPNSVLAMSVVAPGNGPAQDWTGTIDGPGTFDWTWKSFGVSGPNYSSNQYSVGTGTYKFTPGSPVKQGWVVTGYAPMEIPNQPFPTCPQSPASYSLAANTVTVSDAHPRQAMCVLIEKAVTPTVAPEPTVSTHHGDGSGFPWEPGSAPTVTATPSPTSTPQGPTSTPQGGQPGSTTGTPTATATQPPSGPADESNSGSTGGANHAVSDGPLPPNTGTGHGAAEDEGLAFKLGLLLMAASGLIVAATQLPGRARR